MVLDTQTNWSEFSEGPSNCLGLEYLFPQGRAEEYAWLRLESGGLKG